MKKLLLIPFVLFQCAISAQNPAGNRLDDYRMQFWDQIARTCSDSLRWEKSVQELSEGEEHAKESKIFAIDCRLGFATNTGSGEATALETSEFAELFEYDYDDPYIRDYLDVETREGYVHAEVKPDQAGSTALQKQVFEVDAATGNLRYAEVKVVKRNLLYDFELHTRVWFDAQGQYERHTTETYTRVVLSGSVRTIIEGKRLS